MKIPMVSQYPQTFVWHVPNRAMKCMMYIAFLFIALPFSVEAQEYRYERPRFWMGVTGGANLNYHRGSTQMLNSAFTSPVAFHNGNNVGLYLAPLLEYHDPSGLGAMLQIGYDGRKSVFEQQTTVCNCPADLSVNLRYLTIEPSLRIAPFKSGFYLFGGPRFAFNVGKAFTYKLGINPDYPDQLPTPDVKGDLSDVKTALVSMQIGAGYDIPVSSQDNSVQMMISPFFSFQPYFGQSPRSVETWNITTLRVGAALKFGKGRPVSSPAIGSEGSPLFDGIRFTVISPRNIPIQRRVNETFPLRNYVYFNEESSTIPDRYVTLRKNQIAGFKEDQLEAFAPKTLSGRSDRGMIVYYNVLNILGDRLGKSPSSNIQLLGQSEKGIQDGLMMAESVRSYLTDVWGIDKSRISVEGRESPAYLSSAAGSAQDELLFREGNRKVMIKSASPELLMEFQSGPDARLKPVKFIDVQEAPMDSYVTFNVEGARNAFSSWRMEIRDDTGKIQKFGPYKQEQVMLPGKSIMGSRAKGKYNVTMLGTTSNGAIIKRDAEVDMVLWTPPQNEIGTRYSVIYEFDESKLISIYEGYLTSVVVPDIPKDARVIISGHTDNIGDALYNQSLSLERAKDVRRILTDGLKVAGRSDVKFEVNGMGEDQMLAPFGNSLPEERAHNRTVIIDIIPKS
jgi:outer membrane protein OmpA-like peptidoglycan-associated protein